MAVSVFKVCYNHHRYLIPEYLHHLQKNPVPTKQSLLIPLFPNPTILNHAPWTLIVQSFVWTLAFSYLGCIPRNRILDHILVLRLIFWGAAKLFPTEAAPFYILTNHVWGFQFLHTLASCFFLFFFLPPFYSHPSGCEMVYISQRVFKKHFGLKDTWKFHPLVHFPFAFCSQCLEGNKKSWHADDIYHVLGALLSSSLAQLQSIDVPDFISNPDSSAQTSQKVEGEADCRHVPFKAWNRKKQISEALYIWE